VVRGASQTEFDRVNVDGTAAVVASLKRQDNSPRLLLVSSLAAREPRLSWYAASKRGGEECVRGEPDLDWVILRPPAVYGPGDREMLPVFNMMARGIAPVAGASNARIALIHVTDLVDAIIACLQCEATTHRTLSPSDGRPDGYDWEQMAAIAGNVWSRRVRLWRIPHWLLNSVASVNLSLSRLLGRPPMLTPAKLRELRHPDWRVDVHEMTEATGWEPAIDLRRGLQQLQNSEL
jgi:nucleoside-diphosphate-sugar epimerase